MFRAGARDVPVSTGAGSREGQAKLLRRVPCR